MTGLMHEKEFSREAFLKGGGALIVGFSLAGAGVAAAATSDTVPFPNVDPSQLDSWLTIGQDGKVTVFTGRVDLGQHKQTAFGQIVGDELDVAFDSITLVMGDTARTVNQGASTASNGLLIGGKALRHAAAEARRVLLNLAAAELGVAVIQLTVSDGVVSGGGKSVAYGDLIGNQRFNTSLQVTATTTVSDVQGLGRIKDPSQYKLIGKSIPSVTIPSKVTGAFTYVQNIRLPGMVHARVVMPPSVGAHLISVDGFKTRPEGLIRVVSIGDFLALVTHEEWQAIQALNTIKTTWNESSSLPGSGNVFHYLRTTPPINTRIAAPTVGNVDTALAGASRTFSAQYNYPGNNHGMIGPPCAVADVRGNQCIVWSGTQTPFGTQTTVAQMLGLPATSVRVLPFEGSGAYGRMGTDDAAPAAAYISQQIGRPVRVQWMRQQEQPWEPAYPPYAFTFQAGVDSTGKVVAWDNHTTSWPYNSNDYLPLQLAARRQPDVTGRNASTYAWGLYAFDNMRWIANTVPALLRGAQLRSVGILHMNFASEQFLDEIAAATGQDPIAFRLRHLGDNIDSATLVSGKPRTTAVLQAAQQASGWQTRPSPGPGAKSTARVVSGHGVSVLADESSAYIANVSEVEVDKKTGKVRVTRMHVAVDVGQIVNPNGVKSQVEGATIMGTSRALKEQVTFDKSKVTNTDWVTYPIIRFNEVPQEINITLLDRPTLSPAGSFDNGGVGSYVNSGIGEPSGTVVAAAIGNAIFDATGVRMREAPYTPARVRAALKAAGVA